jgi:tetratricopeptide (TPR) repeat protein
MSQNARRRARAASRARAQLPRHRRPNTSQKLARRGIIVLGIVVVASLLIAVVGTIGSSNGGGQQANPTLGASDPNRLIAAATANPNDGDTVGALADYYDKTGQYQQALSLYRRYIALRPDDARARVSIGELLLASGDIPGAQVQLSQAIALKPTDRTAAQAHLGLGNADTALQPPRLADALNEFKLAADLDPTGEIGGEARDRLAALQGQLGIATVPVVAPSIAVPSPTGAP